jgi:hypothetical protein
MSKIALCFSGLPRLVHDSMVAWKAFIDANDADVFIHTWVEPNANKAKIIDDIYTWVTPKQLMIEPVKTFNTTIYTERIWPHRSQPNNVLSMWYSVRQSIILAIAWQNAKEYDMICRCRFDWWCEDLQLYKANGLTVPYSPTLHGHNFTYKGNKYTAHNDQFGYGNTDVMTEYANTFDRLPWLYMDDGVDFCSELFLTANMMSANIPITYQQNMNCGVIK